MLIRGKANRVRRGLALLALGLLIAVILAGCGGGSSSSSPTGAEPSAQFLKQKSKGKEGNAAIVKFGEEAPAEEREAANTVVVASLKAREEAEFKAQCETLSIAGIEEIPGAKGRQDCPSALKQFAEPLSATKKARKDTLSGSIAAMRVKGSNGYALYRGSDGKNYAVPLEREDGAWKVGSVLTKEI